VKAKEDPAPVGLAGQKWEKIIGIDFDCPVSRQKITFVPSRGNLSPNKLLY
jgi:hypothetical protein